MTTVTFTLPFAIPSNGTTIPLELFFATFNGATWVADARPFTITVTPPTGSTDPDTGNNVVVSLPEYTPAP